MAKKVDLQPAQRELPVRLHPDYSGMDSEQLLRLLLLRDRQSDQSRKLWIRAARKALFEGDARELRNRLELAEMPPVELIQS
jgi:hypothetical protein